MRTTTDSEPWGSTTLEVTAQHRASLLILRELRELEDDDAVVNRLREQLNTVLGFDRLDLYSIESGELSRIGDPPDGFSVARSSFEKCITGREERVWVTLPEPPMRGDEPAMAQGMQSSLMLPLVTRGAAVGLLVLYSKRPGAYRLSDAQDLVQIVEFMAQLLLWRRLLEAETALRRSQAMLAAREKLAALGRLSAGIAHEINNPAAYALTNLEHVVEVLGMDAGPLDVTKLSSSAEEIDKALRESIDGIRRIRSIVAELSVFSRGAEEVSEPVDLNEIARAAAHMASSELRARARVDLALSKVPRLVSNKTRLTQVALNLMLNAAQACAAKSPAGEGILRISTRVDQNRAVLEVQDNGVGMSREVREHVFEPFFTTRPVGQGTGLGLAVSREIVRKLGGSITLTSEVGVGSTFSVFLPLRVATATPARPRPAGVATNGSVEGAAPSLAPALPAPAEEKKRDGPVRVLVIDDEPAILRSIRRALRTCDVSVAESGKEALALIAASTQPFDVILCDLLLPRMSGMEIFERVEERDPTLARRMLFLTGGAVSAKAQAFVREHRGALLPKPTDLDRLQQIVQRVGTGEPVEQAVENTRKR